MPEPILPAAPDVPVAPVAAAPVAAVPDVRLAAYTVASGIKAAVPAPAKAPCEQEIAAWVEIAAADVHKCNWSSKTKGVWSVMVHGIEQLGSSLKKAEATVARLESEAKAHSALTQQMGALETALNTSVFNDTATGLRYQQLCEHHDSATALLTQKLAELQQAHDKHSQQMETLLSAQAKHTAASEDVLASLAALKQTAVPAGQPWATIVRGRPVPGLPQAAPAPQPAVTTQPQRKSAYVRLVPEHWWNGPPLPERQGEVFALAQYIIAELRLWHGVLRSAHVQRKQGKPIALVLEMPPEDASALLHAARQPLQQRPPVLRGWRVLEHLLDAEYRAAVAKREALRTKLHEHFAEALSANKALPVPAKLGYRNQYTTLLIGATVYHLPLPPPPPHPAPHTAPHTPPAPPPSPPAPPLSPGAAPGAAAPAPNTS